MKTGKAWTKKVIARLLNIMHGLWIERCRIVHARVQGGLYVEENRQLKEEVWREAAENFRGDDFENRVQALWEKPIDYIRGWLIDSYIAKGKNEKDEEEMKKNRDPRNKARRAEINFGDVVQRDRIRRENRKEKRKREKYVEIERKKRKSLLENKRKLERSDREARWK